MALKLALKKLNQIPHSQIDLKRALGKGKNETGELGQSLFFLSFGKACPKLRKVFTSHCAVKPRGTIEQFDRGA